MPTIDQLAAALAVADSDTLPLSQNGVVAHATRAQFLADTQPQIALAGGQLLGRSSAGVGGPEVLGIGAGLVLSGGSLSASGSLGIAGLPAGVSPGPADSVALGQSGRTVGVSYAQFMAGVTGVPGLDLSGQDVLAHGASAARALADIAADAVVVEAFGARGDGMTDDTAAFAAAVAAGVPLRLGAKTYVIGGQFTIAHAGTVLLGVAGVTTLRRGTQSGSGAWIAVQADGFRADGVIFDANSAVTQDSWGVLVTPAALSTEFHRCVFRNAMGAVQGCGLVFQASDPAMCLHVVRDCEFSGNAVHGLWVQACAGVLVQDCRAYGNGQYGLNVDFNDASFRRKAHLAQLLGNRCWGNQRGISVGNYNATNAEPPVWGNANPDALAVLVAANLCHDNTIYGIAVAGSQLSVQGNTLSGNGSGIAGAGILANVAHSRVCDNMVVGASVFGIDCGGSLASDVSGNYVTGAAIGINCGGGNAMRVADNTMQDCPQWAIAVQNVETDGAGRNFGVACSNLAITGNWIGVSNGTSGGVLLADGPQNVLVARNHFVGSIPLGNCLWANTDSVLVEGNRWNFSARFVCNPQPANGLQQLVFPDIADTVMITAAAGGVQSMVSSWQAACTGKISFIRVTAGGSGYSHASVAIAGTGTGAAASAVISGGVVIGAVVSAVGSGYGAVGTAVPVVVTGDGSGCTAVGYAAPPLPEERRLLIRCNTPVHFSRAGSVPLQENWTGTDIDVPADGDVEWAASWGMWRAGRFAPVDYLAADGAGGSILRSVAGGDVALHPNGAGHVRLASDAEPVGCLSALGRGSPLGVVAAPPGSDYRNLNGGAGATWWVKQSASDATGWVAIG